MRILRYLAAVSILCLPAAYARAQVGVGVGVGPYAGYGYGPPACSYGYYDYAPYACAPYGYYGPAWFLSLIHISDAVIGSENAKVREYVRAVRRQL